MASSDRVRWDAYYRERKNQPLPPPDPLLLQWTPPVPEGETRRALDAAAGLGQNGIWLAQQGYTTDVMEVSRVALSRARAEATMRNLRNVNLLQTDFDDFDLSEQYYDVICIFRYLKRDMMRQIKAATVPDGRIIYETFNLHYLDLVPEFNAEFLLNSGELHQMFSDWTILHDVEDGHISQLVAINATPPAPDSDEDEFDW
jgi:tellurite methyltransferase